MKILIAIFIVLSSSITFGQKDRYLSFELAGSGGFASLNFETSFLKRESFELDYRIGFSFAPIDANNGTVLIFPLMVHGIYGKHAHKFDVGIGQTISVTTRGAFYAKLPISLGYRFQPLDKNYYLRAAYTPIVGYLVDLQWQHWGGITFGLKLNRK